jgi:hypothetical protein
VRTHDHYYYKFTYHTLNLIKTINHKTSTVSSRGYRIHTHMKAGLLIILRVKTNDHHHHRV